MNQDNITLELLVRTGNQKNVELFFAEGEVDDTQKAEKMNEAIVYSVANFIRHEYFKREHHDRVCAILSQQDITDYLSSTTNTTLLADFADAMLFRAGDTSRLGGGIGVFDTLEVNALTEAFQRNADSPELREKAAKLVEMGYNLLFSRMGVEEIEHYLPVVDKLRVFVNPTEIVKKTICGFDLHNLLESHKEAFYIVLDKLIELTDKEMVSKLMYNCHRGGDWHISEPYLQIVKDGKIDLYTPPEEKGVTPAVIEAVKRVEQGIPSSIYGLEKATEKRSKEYIAKKIGEWFRQGNLSTVAVTIKYDNTYDHETARKVLTEAIAKAVEVRDLVKLDCVLGFPAFLIDKTNPALSSVVRAYEIHQKTRRT